MRKMKFIGSIMIISFFMASCSVVKSPQADNFKRVKYNSHLKLAKSDKKDKPINTVSSFTKETAVEVSKSEKLDRMNTRPIAKEELTASSEKVIAKPKVSIIEKVALTDRKNEIKGIFYHESEPLSGGNSTISTYMNSLAPVASSEELPLGDILYVILVVLLILIVLSLISDLAGGLIGALLAILLILLILRILGYV